MHYVIGDVHGCYKEMIALLKTIEEKDRDAQIIFVGDFVDRGPDVDKVLEWCLQNITPDGKYQSVRGNHEDMILSWYPEWKEWWNRGANESGRYMPETDYDFSKWMAGMGKLTPEGLEPYIRFFQNLPYSKALDLTSIWGKTNTFRIVHAYYEHGDVSPEKQHHSNLWMRMDCGNLESDEILVHGHTPTFIIEYQFVDSRNTHPGMISYRRHDINLDGGCVFSDRGMYPYMLGAICLETLEEIYPYTLEERYQQIYGDTRTREEIASLTDSYRENYLSRNCLRRDEILAMMGALHLERGPVKALLFPSSPHDINRADDDLQEEWDIASSTGLYEIILFDYDVWENEGRLVLSSRPCQETATIYRGWQMNPMDYHDLYVALLDEDIRLITRPDEYEHFWDFDDLIPDLISACNTPTNTETGNVCKENLMIRNGMTNEYRVFYANGKIISVSHNPQSAPEGLSPSGSEACVQPDPEAPLPVPPTELLNCYCSLPAPLYHVDFAELRESPVKESGEADDATGPFWKVIRAADGSISDLAESQDTEAFYRELKKAFPAADTDSLH